MSYVPDIYELTNTGIIVLLVLIVAIILWTVYDWDKNGIKYDELEGYNFYFSRRKKKK